MIRSLAAGLALALFAMSAVGQDATTPTAGAVSGSVQVRSANGTYGPLQAGQVLQPGDQVMALGSGTTTISFPGGCSKTVEPGTVMVVPAVSPCGPGAAQPQVRQIPNGAGAGAAGASAGIDWTAFWIIAGTVIIGDAASFEENKDASP